MPLSNQLQPFASCEWRHILIASRRILCEPTLDAVVNSKISAEGTLFKASKIESTIRITK